MRLRRPRKVLENEHDAALDGRQAMLREVRFGGGGPPSGLRRPGRAWLGIGLLAGLGIAAAGLAVFHGAAGSPPAIVVSGSNCEHSEIEENGLTFVRICAGTFTMGSRNDDPLADDAEKPAHPVTLDEFWLSKHEVTNGQYRKIDPDHTGEPDLPVTWVSWFDASNFCKKLGYRLPTEAEWEYAARAGTETPWSSGSDEKDLGRFAWFDENSDGEPHPVGRKEPNPWGLHDMHGSVWEWVEDHYGPYPEGPRNEDLRVLRGGSFVAPAGKLRSALRLGTGPGFRFWVIGFRCARAPRRGPDGARVPPTAGPW